MQHNSVIRALREKLNNSNNSFSTCSKQGSNPVILTNSSSIDDSFLLRFLKSRNYNVNDSFRSMNNYFQVKKSYPQLFKSPRNFADVFSDNIAGVLPGRGPNGESIILCKPGNWNPSKIPIYHMLGASVCMQEQQGLDRMTQENGIILIIDMKNTSLTHLIQLTPATISLGVNLALKALPIKYKEIHVLNSNWIAQAVWALGCSLLDDNTKNNTHFHKSYRKLGDYLPIDTLPTEYGGKESSWTSREYYEQVLLKKEPDLTKVMRISL